MGYSYYSEVAKDVLNGRIDFAPEMTQGFSVYTRRGIVRNYIADIDDWHSAIYPIFVASFGSFSNELLQLFIQLQASANREEALSLVAKYELSEAPGPKRYIVHRSFDALRYVVGKGSHEIDKELLRRKLQSLATISGYRQEYGLDNFYDLIDGGRVQLCFNGHRLAVRRSLGENSINDFLTYVQQSVGVRMDLPSTADPNWLETMEWFRSYAQLSNNRAARGKLEFIDGEEPVIKIIFYKNASSLEFRITENSFGIWVDANWQVFHASAFLKIEDLFSLSVRWPEPVSIAA